MFRKSGSAIERQAKEVEARCGFKPGRILYFVDSRAGARGMTIFCSVILVIVCYFAGRSAIYWELFLAVGIALGIFEWVTGRPQVITLMGGDLVWNIHAWSRDAVRVAVGEIRIYRAIEADETWRAEIQTAAGWHLLGDLSYNEHCRICRALQEVNPHLNWEEQRVQLPTLREFFLGKPRKK